MHEILIQ